MAFFSLLLLFNWIVLPERFERQVQGVKWLLETMIESRGFHVGLGLIALFVLALFFYSREKD